MRDQIRAFILSGLLYAPGVLAEEVTVYASADYHPVTFKNEQGKPDGFGYKLIKHYEEFSGKKINYESGSWRRAYSLAEKGRGGIIGLSKTKPRTEIFDYSDPFFVTVVGVVVKKGKEFQFDSVADLKGKLIGVTNGASYGEEFDAAVAAKLFKVDVNYSSDIRLKKVLYGRVDCALVSYGALGLEAIFNEDAELKSHRNQFVYLNHPLLRDPIYLAFHKSMKMGPFLNQFNQAIKDAKQKGVIPNN
ncbi:MAG: substrate-binding periplasmic protein [Iodobacter sp.]